MKIGIMQGRLLPPMEGRFQCFPVGRWPEEFGYAEAAGLAAIEWIYDAFGVDDNPIATDAGIARIRSLADKHGVRVASVCADYFMDLPYLRSDLVRRGEIAARLEWLIERCAALAIERIVLPFVDASRIDTATELDATIEWLSDVLRAAEVAGIELHLETDLAPVPFAELLGRLAHPLIKVNYDSGNSASLGYDPRVEFEAYGERVGSVHIKDRILGGGTVPLGAGDTDFAALSDLLKKYGFAGDFVLQAARGPAGSEIELARKNRDFADQHGLTRRD
jgi:hexulose-6-phosphate isomerase